MAWARLDDRFHDNRKVKRAWRRAPAAVGLHVMAITYSAGHMTDGFIDVDFVEDRLPIAKQRDRCVGVLVEAGLWHEVDGGWQIHDFSDFNITRDAADAKHRAKVEAGRRGGEEKWRKERITQQMRRDVADRFDVPVGEERTITCAYCSAPITIVRANDDTVKFLDSEGAPTPELDHVESLANGGAHASINLAPACLHCNRAKGPSSNDIAGARGGGLAESTPNPNPTRPVEEAKASSSAASRADRERAKASDDDRRLCRLLAEFIRARNPKVKIKNDAVWLRSMRLCREADGNTPAEIEQLIRWTFTDTGRDANFWADTIQSSSGLREHFAKAWAKMNSTTRLRAVPEVESSAAYLARRGVA